jgi:hypothetical protein
MWNFDRDGLLAHEEMRKGVKGWGLQLAPDAFTQFVDCHFMYADRDCDGLINLAEWTRLFKVMSKVRPKRLSCHWSRGWPHNR